MTINLGNIKQGTTAKLSVSFIPAKQVSSVRPSCGCMDVYFKDNKIHLTYRADKLSNQILLTQGYQNINNFITVYYTDGSSTKMSVTGKVVQ